MTADQERQAAAWMQVAQQGDQAAYASLLAMLTSVTRQFARRRLGGVAWIDDVVQETLLAVHGARQTYDAARPFAPWFYAIASSRMIDVIRRERRVESRQIATDVLPEPRIPRGRARRDRRRSDPRGARGPATAAARGDRAHEARRRIGARGRRPTRHVGVRGEDHRPSRLSGAQAAVARHST